MSMNKELENYRDKVKSTSIIEEPQNMNRIYLRLPSTDLEQSDKSSLNKSNEKRISFNNSITETVLK